MTVTIETINETTIHKCEATTNSNMDGIDGTTWKEGTYSLYATKRAAGNNDCTFNAPTGGWDLSGTGVHVRFWYLCTNGGLINLAASGGIQLGLTDGTNTGYWYLGGRDTYTGGWQNFCVDVSAAVDSGTKPTSMNAITQVIIRTNLTAIGKNVDNLWIDNIWAGDGILCYGDSGTGNQPFDLADIQAVEDVQSTGGTGIVKQIGGVSFTTGAIHIGDDTTSANDAYFESTNEVLVVEDRPIAAGICTFKPVANVDTGQVVEFALGQKSGTAGISGSIVTTEDPTQTAKWVMDGTGNYIDEFFLFGSTFIDGTVTLPNNSTIAEAEVLDCSFVRCGPTDVNICNIKNCKFISADDVGALIQSTSHNLTYCDFIDCDHGIEFDTAGTYSLQYCYFTTSTGQYDIEFSDPTTGSDLIINATKGDPSTYEITGNGDSVTINNTVILTIACVNASQNPIAGARVYLVTDDTAATEIFNDLTDTAGEVTDTGYNFSGEEAVTGWARKGSSAPYYETAPIQGTITADGLDLVIQMVLDQ